jgi:pilus assembly protein CpaB
LASNQTHIQLDLRNPLDTQTAQMPGTAMSSLFANTNKAPAKAKTVALNREAKKAAPHIYSVVVYNGSQRTEQKFEYHEEKQ